MLLTFVGKPGDGKTLFAVRQILDELIETEVFVVTNIPLLLPAVNEYVSKAREAKGIEVPFAIDDRLKVIPDSEVYEFYRHRSGGLVLPWSPDKDTGEKAAQRLDRPAFVAAMKANFLRITEAKEYQLPCHYYIDEAHNFFSSRDWATNGRGTLYYASQHRHLHDKVVLITQVLENVEKQLRGLVSETYSIRNYLRRRLGIWKCRPVFKASLYYGTPSEGAQKKPFDVITFHLDPARVGSCYRTTGALGVHTTPEKISNKGLPWWTMYAAAGLVVSLVGGSFIGLPYLGAYGARKAIGVPPPVDQGSSRGSSPAVAAPLSASALTSRALGSASGASSAPVVPPAPRRQKGTTYLATGDGVTVVRYYVDGYTARVELSDGSILDHDSPRLGAIGRDFVTIDGERILWRSAPSEFYSAPPPPPSVVPSASIHSVDTVATVAPAVTQSEGAGAQGLGGR